MRLVLRPLVPALLLTATLGCNEQTAVASADQSPRPPPAKAAASQPAPAASKTALAKGESPAERDQVDQDGVVRRGTDLPESKQLTVADCVAKAKELGGKEVLISGRVAQVCAKKGCWWSIENPSDPSQRIRVTHKDYGFFVPRDAKGQLASAYGVLEVKQLSQAEAEHLAKDEGQTAIDPAKLPKVELRLVASALEMRKAS